MRASVRAASQRSASIAASIPVSSTDAAPNFWNASAARRASSSARPLAASSVASRSAISAFPAPAAQTC